jgi:hypothetical protein
VTRPHDKRRAVRTVLYRLGLQARADEVVAALAELGVVVGAGLVRGVRLEILQDQYRTARQRTRATPPDRRPDRRRHQQLPRRNTRG